MRRGIGSRPARGARVASTEGAGGTEGTRDRGVGVMGVERGVGGIERGVIVASESSCAHHHRDPH
eukprot:1208478-Rhodomonas_salina.2